MHAARAVRIQYFVVGFFERILAAHARSNDDARALGVFRRQDKARVFKGLLRRTDSELRKTIQKGRFLFIDVIVDPEILDLGPGITDLLPSIQKF